MVVQQAVCDVPGLINGARLAASSYAEVKGRQQVTTDTHPVEALGDVTITPAVIYVILCTRNEFGT